MSSYQPCTLRLQLSRRMLAALNFGRLAEVQTATVASDRTRIGHEKEEKAEH